MRVLDCACCSGYAGVEYYFFFVLVPFITALFIHISSSLAVAHRQTQGHYKQVLLPLPTTVYVPSVLSREDFSPFFPRRLASNWYLCTPWRVRSAD